MEEAELIVEAIEELKKIVFWASLNLLLIGVVIILKIPRK